MGPTRQRLPDGARRVFSLWTLRTARSESIAGQGRHNHENTVVVPGGWTKGIVSLSGDDTFTRSTAAAEPQPALHDAAAKHWKAFQKDEGDADGLPHHRQNGSGPVDPERLQRRQRLLRHQRPATRGRRVHPRFRQRSHAATTPGSCRRTILRTGRTPTTSSSSSGSRTSPTTRTARAPFTSPTPATRGSTGATTGRLRRLLSSSDPLVPQSKTPQGRLFKMVFNASRSEEGRRLLGLHRRRAPPRHRSSSTGGRPTTSRWATAASWSRRTLPTRRSGCITL